MANIITQVQHWGWPQWIIIGIWGLSLVLSMAKAGQLMSERRYGLNTWLDGVFLLGVLLVWGGFFR